MPNINSVVIMITIYLIKKSQIFFLFLRKFIIRAENLNFINLYLKNSVKMLLEYTKNSEYAIKLE